MKQRYFLKWLTFTLVSIFLISTYISAVPFEKESILPRTTLKIKGFSWEGTDSVGVKHIETIRPYHANWIAQTPFGWQAHVNDPKLVFTSDRGYWGERDVGLIHTTRAASSAGVQTMLKPHIWLGRNSGGWRSDISMNSEEEWQEWFRNYEKFILHYARLAEAQNIPILCIGTELYQCAAKREQDWRYLIAKVREVYSGQLTYAANFYKEYEAIQFWDALDYIGIQGYFPLSKKEDPTLDELMEGWRPHYKSIRKFSKKWDRPVMFTELGYRSMRNAAIEPWVWPNGLEFTEQDVSEEVQARCYEAFFNVFWEEDWVTGVFFWKWSRRNYKPEAYAERLQRRRRRDLSPIDFSPKEKALEVVQNWFSASD
jgi:hypothetical protein